MKDRHLTGNELLDRLYGIGRQDAHFEECAECRERWEELQKRRAGMLAEPALDPVFLARQRAAILERIEHRPVAPARLAPALSVALLVLMAVLVTRPAKQPAPEVAVAGDSQIFSEVYELIQQDVPRAGLPIQRLFEEQQ